MNIELDDLTALKKRLGGQKVQVGFSINDEVVTCHLAVYEADGTVQDNSPCMSLREAKLVRGIDPIAHLFGHAVEGMARMRGKE